MTGYRGSKDLLDADLPSLGYDPSSIGQDSSIAVSSMRDKRSDCSTPHSLEWDFRGSSLSLQRGAGSEELLLEIEELAKELRADTALLLSQDDNLIDQNSTEKDSCTDGVTSRAVPDQGISTQLDQINTFDHRTKNIDGSPLQANDTTNLSFVSVKTEKSKDINGQNRYSDNESDNCDERADETVEINRNQDR